MRLLTLALVAVVVGCSSATEPNPDRVLVLGTIVVGHRDDVQIEIVPDSQSVIVRLTTFGNGCYSKGQTEVILEGLEATITPWDYYPAGSNFACADILLGFTHEAAIPYPATGPLRILVRGIDESTARSGYRGDVITVERTVEIP